MPNYDLHQKFEEVRYYLPFDPSMARSGGSTKVLAGGSICEGGHADADDNIVDWSMSIDGMDGTGTASDGTYAHLDIPQFGATANHTIDAGTLVTANCELVLTGVKVFSYAGGEFVVTIEEAEWFVDGVSRWSDTTITLVNDTYFAPSGVPFFGIPPNWACNAVVSPVEVLGYIPTYTTPGTVSAEVTIDVAGAYWKVKEYGGSLQGFPIEIDLPSLIDVECPCDGPALTTLTCTNTDSITVQAYAKEEEVVTDVGEVECDPCSGFNIITPSVQHVYNATYDQISKGSQITTIPNLPASVRKLDPDNYAAIIHRGGFPGTWSNAHASCQTAFPAADAGDLISESENYEVHDSFADAFNRVGGTTHAIEAPFAYNCPSPCAKSGYQYHAEAQTTTLVSAGLCGFTPAAPTLPTCASLEYSTACLYTHGNQFAPEIDNRTENPDVFLAFWHDDPIAYYVNTWAARNWHFYYYFPPNQSGAGQDEWQVDGDTTHHNYWIYKGDQWQGGSTLPEAERTGKRNTLISAPLVHGAQASWIETLITGTKTSWWGEGTFRVDETEPVTSKTLTSASSGLWTATDCALTHGSDITINPDPGETSVRLDLNLGTYTAEGYQYPHIAETIEVGWTPTNIVSVTVSLVSADGSTTVVLTTIEEEAERPLEDDVKYAGSWKQDFDSSSVGVSDEGSDSRPEGISSGTMGDTERVCAFGLLGARGAVTLRFDIVVTDPDVNVNLDYPIFRASTGDGVQFPENKSNQSVVWMEGPGVRFGNTQYYHTAAHNESPRVLPPGFSSGMKPSIIDSYSWRNNFLQAKGHDDDLATWITTNFDTLEGTTPAAIHLYSIAYLIPPTDARVFPRAALVNGSACPPMSGVPRRARHDDTLQPTEAWACETVSYAVEPRFIVANREVHHWMGASQWSSVYEVIGDWIISSHSHAVTNAESPGDIKSGSEIIAQFRPWGGFFCVVGLLTADAYTVVAHTNTRTPVHVFAWLDVSGNVVTAQSPNVRPYALTSALSGVTGASWVALSCELSGGTQRVFLVTEESGAIKIYESTDEGRSFGVAVTVAAGPGNSKPAIVTAESNGMRYVYWIVAGSSKIQGKIYGADGTVLEAAFDAVASGVADAGIDAWERVINAGEHTISLSYINGSGDVVTVEATDGKTFA